MAPTRLPSRIRVGAFTYRIVCDDEFFKHANECHDPTNTRGVCDTEQCIIYVKPGLARDVTREILQHEVWHACFSAAGGVDLDAEDGEERFIAITSPMYMQVLHDNPRYVAFLLEEA